MSCASCGFPAPTCCRMGSSICGCCWTTCRSCWNWGLLRKKLRSPIAAAVPLAPEPEVAAPAVLPAPRVLGRAA
jgi:hypothetical protein